MPNEPAEHFAILPADAASDLFGLPDAPLAQGLMQAIERREDGSPPLQPCAKPVAQPVSDVYWPVTSQIRL